MNRRPPGYLKEPKNIIHDYIERNKKGKALNPYGVEQEDQSLYLAICREFDSFDDFLYEVYNDTGDDRYLPETVRKQQRWSLDKIKEELDRIYKQREIIKYHNKISGYNKKQYKIMRMLIYYFSSIERGLKNFNFIIRANHLERLCPVCKNNVLEYNSRKTICDDCRKSQ